MWSTTKDGQAGKKAPTKTQKKWEQGFNVWNDYLLFDFDFPVLLSSVFKNKTYARVLARFESDNGKGERRKKFLVEGLQVHGHLPASDFLRWRDLYGLLISVQLRQFFLFLSDYFVGLEGEKKGGAEAEAENHDGGRGTGVGLAVSIMLPRREMGIPRKYKGIRYHTRYNCHPGGNSRRVF